MLEPIPEGRARGGGAGGSPAPRPASLGNTTKSASATLGTQKEPKLDADGCTVDGFVHRLRRWRLQGAARRLMHNERVGHCMYSLQKRREWVGVRRRADSATYYEGLQVCGSVWMCPVCSAKIAERRRVEMVGALKEWRSQGKAVYLLTLTVPHYQHHQAFELVDTVLELVRRFWSGRGAASGLISGYVGQVRALEVTHGANGWHPHVHVLLFLDKALNPAEKKAAYKALYGRWAALVRSSGLGEPNHHALSLEGGDKAAGYVTKWGFAEEITKQHQKSGLIESRTPFQLLEDYCEGDKKAGRLFKVYAGAFKGKRQLYWSRALRDLLGLSREKTDEEIASAVDACDYLVASFSRDDWQLIRRNGLRGEVLEVARVDPAGIWQLLALYRPQPSVLK